ncbi:Bacterial PH domain protein [uncultured archaeon]|nr:Bacterial PH domain protein [uncultured archaeon]
MNEIPNILEPKEKVVYDGKPEFAPYITSTIFGSIVAGAVIGIVIGALLKSVIVGSAAGIVILVLGIVLANMSYTRTHYAITNKRAIIQSGIIGRDFKSVDYDRMQNVSVDVGILGVIFKVGTIKIFTGEIETINTGKTSSMQSKYDKFHYVSSPYEVLKKLQTELSKRKEALA